MNKEGFTRRDISVAMSNMSIPCVQADFEPESLARAEYPTEYPVCSWNHMALYLHKRMYSQNRFWLERLRLTLEPRERVENESVERIIARLEKFLSGWHIEESFMVLWDLQRHYAASKDCHDDSDLIVPAISSFLGY